MIILPGAFGPGKPFKTLRLSPLHCIYVQGVLVPVTHLVNGATILRDASAPAMTYYHLELDRHDALLAEGLECESYFCNGNRGQLYHELGRRNPARRAFAPNVTGGARLAAVRRRLHELALEAGFAPGYIPRLRAVSGTHDALPTISQSGRYCFAAFNFPEPVRHLTLLCATAAPSDTDPESEDRRDLGLCLREVPGLRLGQGWLPRDMGDKGVWMGSRAELFCDAARQHLRLPIAAVTKSWQRPTPPLARHHRAPPLDASRPTR